jgi:uroporphyrinogen-III synthase
MENLRGIGVLITRPTGQALRLAQTLRAAGAEPLLFPTIEIADTDKPDAAAEILSSLTDFDWAIFISANAVEKTFSLLPTTNLWPEKCRVAAIGAATAEALRGHNIKQILAPETGFDSEALLALPEMQTVKNSRMVIFRGHGGRETLRQTLAARGAEVVYCETYRRIKPDSTTHDLHAWLKQKKIHAINVMSGESLVNLLEMADKEATALKPIPLITHHPRVAQAARDAGFLQVFTCAPGDVALMGVLETLSLGKLTN